PIRIRRNSPLTGRCLRAQRRAPRNRRQRRGRFVSKPLIQTTGRRKESIARVRLRPGTGQIVVNGRPFTTHFPILTHQVIAKEPLRLTQTEEVYDVDATLGGGGVSGQAGGRRLELRPEGSARRPATSDV